MANNIFIHASSDGTLYFDTEYGEFHFVDVEGYDGLIDMARPGYFNLTDEEYKAIGDWIKGLLNNGVLQN
jgi:hypothetical protein